MKTSVQKIAKKIQEAGLKVINTSEWSEETDGLVELEDNFSIQVGEDYMYLNHENPQLEEWTEFEDANSVPSIIKKLKSLKK